MKRFSYGERDYAFGQRMLTLRTSIELPPASHLDTAFREMPRYVANPSCVILMLVRRVSIA